MRAVALVLLAAAIGCRTAPAPAAPHAPADTTTTVAPPAAPPKDPLPDAVERVVQLYETVAALPVESSCERARGAIAAVRGKFDGDLAVVRRARAERPAALEALWTEQRTRLAVAWSGLHQPSCAGASGDEPDLLEEP